MLNRKLALLVSLLSFNVLSNEPVWIKDTSKFKKNGEIIRTNADGTEYKVGLNSGTTGIKSSARTPNILIFKPSGGGGEYQWEPVIQIGNTVHIREAAFDSWFSMPVTEFEEKFSYTGKEKFYNASIDGQSGRYSADLRMDGILNTRMDTTVFRPQLSNNRCEVSVTTPGYVQVSNTLRENSVYYSDFDGSSNGTCVRNYRFTKSGNSSGAPYVISQTIDIQRNHQDDSSYTCSNSYSSRAAKVYAKFNYINGDASSWGYPNHLFFAGFAGHCIYEQSLHDKPAYGLGGYSWGEVKISFDEGGSVELGYAYFNHTRISGAYWGENRDSLYFRDSKYFKTASGRNDAGLGVTMPGRYAGMKLFLPDGQGASEEVIVEGAQVTPKGNMDAIVVEKRQIIDYLATGSGRITSDLNYFFCHNRQTYRINNEQLRDMTVVLADLTPMQDTCILSHTSNNFVYRGVTGSPFDN